MPTLTKPLPMLIFLFLASFIIGHPLAAQDDVPSKLSIATADYKLRGLEHKVKVSAGSPFALGGDGQDALKRIAALYKQFPDHPEVLALFERAKTAVRASKGTFADITPEILAYRNQARELAGTVARHSSHRWSEISTVLKDPKQTIVEPFPVPDPAKVFFADVEGKLVLLDGIEYPMMTFPMGGKTYAFSGSASKGYYYVDTSSREFIAAYEALKRAEQDAAVKLPVSWKIMGTIVDARTMVPRIGKGTEGATAHLGWVVKPLAIYVPDVVLAEFNEASPAGGSYAGEVEIKSLLADNRTVSEATDDVAPDELVLLLLKSAQYRNYSLYLDSIDPTLQETAPQKFLMKYYYDIFVRNVFSNHVTIKITRTEEMVLLQGEDESENVEDLFLDEDLKDKLSETAAPRIEEIKMWLQRYDERGRAVGGVWPITVRRYEALDGVKPNRWYIRRGWPF